MRRAGDDRGSSSTLGLIVGAAVFAIAFVALVAGLRTSLEGASHESTMSTEASNALAALLDGYGQPQQWSGLAWGDVSRIGLRDADDQRERMLDPLKVARAIGTAEDPVSASVLKDRLGLGDGHLRIRVEPLHAPFPNGTVRAVASLRAAYVADYASGSETPGAATERGLLSQTGSRFDGAEATSVSHVGRGDRFRDEALPLARELVPRLAGFDSVAYGVTTDPEPSLWKVVRKTQYGNAAWWASPGGGNPGTPERLLTTGRYDASAGKFVNSAREHSLTLGVFDLQSYDAGWSATLALNHWYDPGPLDAAKIVARCVSNCSVPPADEVVWQDLAAAGAGTKSSFAALSVALPDSYSGERFLLRLVYTHVVPGFGLGSAKEGWFVSYAAVNATRGATRVTVYENALDYRESRYDALVVGSDADHAAFLGLGGVAGSGVRDWVVAGGKLLVLGSPDGSGAWLAPTLTTGTAPAPQQGLLADASDLSHPLVTRPHALSVWSHNYASVVYPANGRLLRVLAGEDPSGGTVPLASVSLPTSAFSGAAILTSARPAKFTDSMEAFRALVNWLAYLGTIEHQGEVGESVHPRVPFGYEQGFALLPGPDGHAPVEITVFVWR